MNELVGRINGKYGTLDYAPIRYINRSVSPRELVALYMVADVCVVSSIRDGMNLVSHEYVACQGEKEVPGVLVLSEFAGSAQSLSGAIRVNPWNTHDLTTAMDAVSTPPMVLCPKRMCCACALPHSLVVFCCCCCCCWWWWWWWCC